MLHRISKRAMSVLVLAEHDGKKLSPGTLSCITAAKKINSGPVNVLVTGSNSKSAAEAASKVTGVDAVLEANDKKFDHAVAENVASLLVSLQKQQKFSHILAVASNEGKNILPRAAALLDAQPISDIVQVVSADTFVRPVYAGNALATVQSSDPVKLLTVRGTAFEKAKDAGGSAKATPVSGDASANAAEWKEDKVVKSDRPELASAKRVVAGGRGMKSGENFKMLYDLADKMGAAVGASRAAVDAGYVPNDLQIGQTGKVVAPELYIAVGISGAVQHLAGMKDSKVIASINKDPEAPIFQISDFGLEADLFKAVPEMTQKL
jgi:electron transfer flavoprotein alpha subunit